MQDVKDHQQVLDFLQQFNERSRDFILKSNLYSNSASQLQLVKDATEFTMPKPLVTADLPLGENFTLVAWVKAAGTGYLLRKHVVGSHTSCWAWHYPGQFRFGGHDFGIVQEPYEHVLGSAHVGPSINTTLEVLHPHPTQLPLGQTKLASGSVVRTAVW